MHRISRKPQVNQSPRCISDGDSIHLRLPGGLVSISSDDAK